MDDYAIGAAGVRVLGRAAGRQKCRQIQGIKDKQTSTVQLGV